MRRLIMTPHTTIGIDPLSPPPPRVIEDNSPYRTFGAPRPKGVHTKHLTELERFRVRTLYYDAGLTKKRIREITGYSESQIRTAVRAKTAAVGRRPGRPKKGSRPSDVEVPSPNSSDANAELMQQAQNYFAQEDSMTSIDGDEDEDDRDGDEEEDFTRLNALTTSSASVSAPASITGSIPVLGVVSTAFSRPKCFIDLPLEIRIHIWRCVLSTSPTQIAPSRSWAIAVLPRQPWLELGISPPNVRFENPPWGHYVDTRHVPAMVLTQVNREARGIVLERHTPILVSQTIRESSRGIPMFIWVDRYSDVIHFFGERFQPDLFEQAGRSACPELYR
ncbi:hypothetical protein HD806DRAFT_455030 [Xylariaceae sp. AK1471]|nr:hypothetical protein HD806DRAFT_455030 [Xylariaceae sp. AK1471]